MIFAGLRLIRSYFTTLLNARHTERRLRGIFESNMIGLCISDRDGNILEANHYYCKLLGVDPNMVSSGQVNWRNYSTPLSTERTLEALRELRETGHTEPFEKEYHRADGKNVSVLVSASCLDENTHIGFILDLSRSKMAERLSRSEKFLESIVEFIPNIIFVKDAKDLRFVRFNRAGEKFFGRPRAALLGKNDYDLFPKEQADFFVGKDHTVLSNGVIVDIPEEPIDTPNGLRILHTKKIPIFDQEGVPQYLVGISEDITERKIAERQQAELVLAQAAQAEAEKSADRMAILTDQANEANRAKSAFLANISHELRTPLGAMLGFAELALESDSSAKSLEYVRTVLRNGKELLRIVDEVLDLSKAESDSMDIENIRFSLPGLLRDIEQLLIVRTAQKKLILNFKLGSEIPEFVLSDPYRLRQILLNVVGNAIKFTEAGSVSIETSFAGDMLKIIVSDTGIGIPADQAKRLFRPFTQADDSTTRKFGGTGLGLFISRKLAQLMGGDVDLLESTPMFGSRFQITIRLTPAFDSGLTGAGTRDLLRPQDKIPDLSGCKVMVVDDSEDNQDLIEAYLAGSRIQVVCTGRGLLAVELADDSYNAILMDIQMPEMDGFEALRLIRAKNVKVPVIAVTAHAMKGDRERCLASGFDDYLSKPLSKSALTKCLARYRKP